MTVDPSAVTAASPGAGNPAAAPNEVVGKYRLERELGAGGMGVVWAAVDPDLERPVAIKLLKHEASEELPMRTRLLREARAMARLRHPNVVTVFEVGSDKGRDYIAMELVEGGTLDDWLQTKPARAAIVEALLAAGRGLAAAHVAGVVHRDFKPHNVLRAKDGHIYVTDFGLARGQIEEGPSPELFTFAVPVEARRRDAILDSRLTQTGVLIGTPAYMAPEQFEGGLPDPKSDQFAFCVTAWQALTGERPFRGDSLDEIEKAVRGGAKKLVAAGLPQPIRSVLDRGLDPSPEARWPDMPALLDAFAAATSPAKPKRRWLIPVLAGSVLLAGAAVTTIVAVQKNKNVIDDDDVCANPAHAFDDVWTSDRRSSLQTLHNLGAFALMEQIQGSWTRQLIDACDGPRTPQKRLRISCLVRARTEIEGTLNAMEADGNTSLGRLGAHMATVELCDPRSMRDGPQDIPDPPDPPDIPEP
jgi:serine/threonine protein kinase